MRKHLPLIAALVSIVLWAAAFVGIRAAGRSFSPGALALGRLVMGTVLLGALALARPLVRPSRGERENPVTSVAIGCEGNACRGVLTSAVGENTALSAFTFAPRTAASPKACSTACAAISKTSAA